MLARLILERDSSRKVSAAEAAQLGQPAGVIYRFRARLGAVFEAEL